jgi:CheY-like chemotaxis protein
MLFDYPDDIPLNVKGDEVRIRQIAMNLISNALKFTHEGYVRLRVGTEQEGENKTVFTIQVEDTGIGIPQDKRDLLFEKFTQVEKSTTRVYGGTGLGLSICKMLATKMNGKITVAPSDSGGSVFAVTLPLETVPFLIPEPDTSYTLEWLRPPRILIVEDSPINQKIASTILEKNGCNTDVAQDGEVALDRLRKEDFDLIFMDLQMPIMNGLEATIAIRASRELFSTIPIIAMTANAMHEEKENCLLAGMNNYLTKPIQEPELKKVLRKQLPSLIKSVSNESEKQPQPAPERSGSVEKIKEIPILDTESALEAIGGHEELLKKLLRVFIENIPEDIDELEKFIASDFKKAAGKAHKLKGESASIGAKKLNILALELEKAAKAENKGRLKKLLSEFKDILKETEKAVEKFSGSDSSSQ